MTTRTPTEERQKEIIAFLSDMAEYGRDTTRDIARHLGVSAATARRWLYRMAEHGIVGYCNEDGDEHLYTFEPWHWFVIRDPWGPPELNHRLVTPERAW